MNLPSTQSTIASLPTIHQEFAGRALAVLISQLSQAIPRSTGEGWESLSPILLGRSRKKIWDQSSKSTLWPELCYQRSNVSHEDRTDQPAGTGSAG